jgi:hypothetical protein
VFLLLLLLLLLTNRSAALQRCPLLLPHHLFQFVDQLLDFNVIYG